MVQSAKRLATPLIRSPLWAFDFTPGRTPLLPTPLFAVLSPKQRSRILLLAADWHPPSSLPLAAGLKVGAAAARPCGPGRPPPPPPDPDPPARRRRWLRRARHPTPCPAEGPATAGHGQACGSDADAHWPHRLRRGAGEGGRPRALAVTAQHPPTRDPWQCAPTEAVSNDHKHRRFGGPGGGHAHPPPQASRHRGPRQAAVAVRRPVTRAPPRLTPLPHIARMPDPQPLSSVVRARCVLRAGGGGQVVSTARCASQSPVNDLPLP